MKWNSSLLGLIVVLYASTAVAGGMFELTAMDSDGRANGMVMFSKWDDAKASYVHFTTHKLRRGVTHIALSPGKYSATVRYTETTPEQVQEIADIVIVEREVVKKKIMFDKGWVAISGWDNDHGVEGVLFYERWDESKKSYEPIKLIALRHTKNRITTPLAPGRYKVRLRYTEIKPEPESSEVVLDVIGGKITPYQFHVGYAPVKTHY